MQNLKLNLLFKDRVGIVADISQLFARVAFNIVAMEVVQVGDQADVYLEVQRPEGAFNKEEVLGLLKGIPDLASLRFISALPRERREKVFRFVLDNVSDGVLSISMDERITTINRMAKKMLECEDLDLEGESISRLKSADRSILRCLKGRSFTNQKRNINTGKGRFRFFATGKPIIGSDGRTMGAVEIMKDMKEIRNLARAVSDPLDITFSDIIGTSPAIKEAITFAQRIATTDAVVSIRGESGTGKELLARAIHAESERKGPFIPINCAALPESLLESELFGYVGGAFTGAQRQGAPGLFETARDGTILLDEIADLPLNPQAKLLRVIQEKTVRRLGGKKEIPINTRIITATNRNLEQMVADKTFRQDLYYRINVLPIHIPPLKERMEDIPILIEQFLFQLATKLNRPAPSFSPGAMKKMRGHDWPGNIRELKNVVERAAILSGGQTIDEEYVLFSFEIGARSGGARTQAAPDPVSGKFLADMMGEYEKGILSQVLQQAGSVRQAARSLGISHTALLNKMKKHRLKLVKK